MQQPVEAPQAIGRGLDEHCRRAVSGLKDALHGLYGSVAADIDRPQDVSRRFKLDKSLTWKISRILRCDDGIDAVSWVPGTEGVSRLLRAMEEAGASSEALDGVRAAMREFDHMVETHAGDRASLSLYIDSMRTSGSMQESRRLAYLGNSGILGLQTRVRFVTRVTAPCLEQGPDDASMLDAALITGMRDLRRLRPLAAWPLYRFTRYHDNHEPCPFDRRAVAIEESSDPNDWLMRSWCSDPLPNLRLRDVGNTRIYELTEGPVGRTGDANVTFGYIDRRAVPRFAGPEDRTGEFTVGIPIPVETFFADFFFHRSMIESEGLTFRVVTQFPGVVGEAGIGELPITVTSTRFDADSSLISTPLMADYEGLMTAVFAKAGWELKDFVVVRAIVEHPPLSSTIIASYELPTAPR